MGGMIFLTIIGVKVVGPPAVMTVAGALPFAGPWPCSAQEVQAPRDLSTTANPGGTLRARAATLTDAQAHKLPQTNIHFILGTEHKSDEYNIATDSEIYDSANPNAVPNSAGEQVVDSRPGYMCPVSGYSAAQLVDNYVWQCCTGEMHIGKTYEVHYVHSNAAPGTDSDPVLYDGHSVHARGLLNPMVAIESVVYTIVNDDDHTYDDLVHGWDIPGLDNSSRVMYPGSTTGNSFNNEFCSPFTVSWHVDKKCHTVSASSFDQMCCNMRDTYGMTADLSPHSARQIVSSQWVVPDDEVLPLA